MTSKYIVEYIWIGGHDNDLRSKCKTLDKYPRTVKDIPIWNYDGSSTDQSDTKDSEIILHPVKMYDDPFRKLDHKLVLCEARLPDGSPAKNNNRSYASDIYNNKKVKRERPWFGLEQEYVLFENNGTTPLGWPEVGSPNAQGLYYCGIGNGVVGRYIMNEHYDACLYAGINISGTNAEVMKGQWEYQIGPSTLLDAGDDMWMSRYILYRICENYDKVVSFHPKPVKGEWNGSGCHVNFSTRSMRHGKSGIFTDVIEKLENNHEEHMKIYGKHNENRMTGDCETSDFEKFTWGIGSRNTSIRIPLQTHKNGKGYIEDRRPGANIDPYLVTSKITHTVLLH